MLPFVLRDGNVSSLNTSWMLQCLQRPEGTLQVVTAGRVANHQEVIMKTVQTDCINLDQEVRMKTVQTD